MVTSAEWLGSFDPANYTNSIECVLDSREAEADIEDPDTGDDVGQVTVMPVTAGHST
jgi:hypothetical protein